MLALLSLLPVALNGTPLIQSECVSRVTEAGTLINEQVNIKCLRNCIINFFYVMV